MADPKHCSACMALYAETNNDELFELYARKLLIRGWAGEMSRAERAYMRAHRSEAQQRQAVAAAAQLVARRQAFPPGSRLQTPSGVKAVSQ